MRPRDTGFRCVKTANGAQPLSYCRIPTSALLNWRGSGRISLNLNPKVAEQLETDAKYDVYLTRQAADVESYRRDEGVVLPENIDYAELVGLSNEARHKLQTHRPRTVGQAGRIDGMTPAALTLLVAHIRRRGGKPGKSGKSGKSGDKSGRGNAA